MIQSEKRILVVDDSTTMRLILRRALESVGYSVAEAKNGEEALLLVRAQKYDLLTLDIDMPGKDGYSICSEIRVLEQSLGRAMVPVVFITSHDSLVDRQRGFDVGATDYISKPIRESELITRVNRLLRAERKLIGLRALVVEDSRATRNIIAHSLRDCGMEVAEAEEGQQAFDYLRQQKKAPDVVITDFEMPVMDGKELCRKIRTVLGLPWMPVIFLTGMSEMSYVLEMFEAGATDCLTKPFTREELVARISVHVELQRLNNQHTKQIEELERLNKLKDGVLAIASHDLRAPLTGIMGYSSLMLMDEDLPADHREGAEGIQSSGECLLHMIEDLLDLARIQAKADELELAPCDIETVLDGAIKVLQHMAAPKGISIVRQEVEASESSALVIHGHRNSILRIINNLVSNAIKFTPRGGKVSIFCKRASSGIIELCVADTGIGIAQEKMGDLFKQFSGASRAGTAGEKGTGLGLSIVKELADLHGAKIHVHSEVSVGTRFVVSFPAAL